MKRGTAQPQLLKFIIISSVCLLLVVVYLSYQTLKIKNLECYYQDQPCPPSITEEVSQQISNHSLFFTNLEKKLSNWKIKKIQRSIPQSLIIYLQPLDNQVQELTVEDLLLKYQVKTRKIEEKDQDWIIYLDQNSENNNQPLRAIIPKKDTELGIFKVSRVLKEINLREIDVAIKEIDARFRLVVLRTEYSPV